MEEKIREDLQVETPERIYKLLSKAAVGLDFTVRDDQCGFPMILDSVKLCRKRGKLFRLVDSGVFDRYQLEWLAAAGAAIYTSDDVRRDIQELELINKALHRGQALMAYFLSGSFGEEEAPDSFSLSDYMNLGRSGIYFYITNREVERDFAQLDQLAFSCRKGGSRLVYYHHGPLVPELADLGRNVTWLHISDSSISGEEDRSLLGDIVRSTCSAGGNLVFHLDKEPELSFISDIFSKGAFVFFKSFQIDYKSPLKPIEIQAAKKKLDFKAFYLHSTVFL